MTISVLLVDDSPIARKMLRKALPTDWQVDIHEAGDGEEALALCRAHRFEVVFVDLTMPLMDGFELVEKLHSEGFDGNIIVVSADLQPGARERALHLGAIEFVTKPVQADALRTVLLEYGVLA